MPEYLSPGVYVEEVPSAIKPIAGVSTSTAAFVGIVPDTIQIPQENPKYDPTGRSAVKHPETVPRFQLLEFHPRVVDGAKDRVDEAKKKLDDANQTVKEAKADTLKDATESLRQAKEGYARALTLVDRGTPVLCTSFTEFKKYFGDFSTDGLLPPGAAPPAPDPVTGATPAPGQNQLAHGVYGFFSNGGTRCYVLAVKDLLELRNPETLSALEAVDEISLVVAPGITEKEIQTNIITHCENLASRFAILDAPEHPAEDQLTEDQIKMVGNTHYGALYFPWIRVFDLATQVTNPDSDGEIWVAPSGHLAGIYARVDHERGVHKAPANEVVRGALDVEYQISKSDQDGLNPHGVNCIRYINDNYTVWGARTIGGDANEDLKYINVRRTLIFLEKSIDEGTQWVVFEPNDRTLWAKIVRNVTAFLTNVWRDGALFGSTPQEAFYVKCDDETNPYDERELGKVTTEIGVAIVRPAEFVIFRISQWAGPQTA